MRSADNQAREKHHAKSNGRLVTDGERPNVKPMRRQYPIPQAVEGVVI